MQRSHYIGSNFESLRCCSRRDSLGLKSVRSSRWPDETTPATSILRIDVWPHLGLGRLLCDVPGSVDRRLRETVCDKSVVHPGSVRAQYLGHYRQRLDRWACWSQATAWRISTLANRHPMVRCDTLPDP